MNFPLLIFVWLVIMGAVMMVVRAVSINVNDVIIDFGAGIHYQDGNNND